MLAPNALASTVQPLVKFHVLAGYAAFRRLPVTSAATGDAGQGPEEPLPYWDVEALPEPQARLRRVLLALLVNDGPAQSSDVLRTLAGLTGKQSPKNEIALLRSYFATNGVDSDVLPRPDVIPTRYGYRLDSSLVEVDLWEFWRLTITGIAAGQCQERRQVELCDYYLRRADDLWVRAARLNLGPHPDIVPGSPMGRAVCAAYAQRLNAKREFATVRASNRRHLERLQDEIEVWLKEPAAHPGLYDFLEAAGSESPIEALERVCADAQDLLDQALKAVKSRGRRLNRKNAHLLHEQLSRRIEDELGRHFPKDVPIEADTPTVEMSWRQFDIYANRIVATLKEQSVNPQVIVAISRGGLPLATRLALEFQCRTIALMAIERYPVELAAPAPEEFAPTCTDVYFPALSHAAACVLIVDDVSASGASRRLAEQIVGRNYPEALPDNIWYACLLADVGRMQQRDGASTTERLVYGRQMRSKGRWIRMPWEHWNDALGPLIE